MGYVCMQIGLQIMWLWFGGWVLFSHGFLAVASSCTGLVGPQLLGVGDIICGDWVLWVLPLSLHGAYVCYN